VPATPVPATSAPSLPVATQAAVVLLDRTSGCAVEATPGDRTVTVIAAGTERSALVHVPSGAAAGAPMALVLSLHGAYGNPDDHAATTGFAAVADEHGFVVAFPAAAGETQTWAIRAEMDTAADVAFIAGLVERLGTQLCLDPRRIYLSGFSAGGAMATILACALDGRIAGVEFVAAVHGPALGDCRPAHPVPTIAFAGLLDPLLPYYGGRIPIPLFRDWPPVEGVDAFMTAWSANNGCTGEPTVGKAIGWAEPVTYQGCTAKTMLYRLGDAGHTWPGGTGYEAFGNINHDVSASELLWSFFNGD
jgi:polyhydroxybutyrate depolymerase